MIGGSEGNEEEEEKENNRIIEENIELSKNYSEFRSVKLGNS